MGHIWSSWGVYPVSAVSQQLTIKIAPTTQFCVSPDGYIPHSSSREVLKGMQMEWTYSILMYYVQHLWWVAEWDIYWCCWETWNINRAENWGKKVYLPHRVLSAFSSSIPSCSCANQFCLSLPSSFPPTNLLFSVKLSALQFSMCALFIFWPLTTY